jgi:hypothetical protein
MSGQPGAGEGPAPAVMRRMRPEQVAAHLANRAYGADPSLENLAALTDAMHALRVAQDGPDPEPGPPLTREQVMAILAEPPGPGKGTGDGEVSADETPGSEGDGQ